eukprot:1320024-Amorphochlora_amoeboformis.AAC.1
MMREERGKALDFMGGDCDGHVSEYHKHLFGNLTFRSCPEHVSIQLLGSEIRHQSEEERKESRSQCALSHAPAFGICHPSYTTKKGHSYAREKITFKRNLNGNID